MAGTNVNIIKYEVDEENQRLASVDLDAEMAGMFALNGVELADQEDVQARLALALAEWKNAHSPFTVCASRYVGGLSNGTTVLWASNSYDYGWSNRIIVFRIREGEYLPFCIGWKNMTDNTTNQGARSLEIFPVKYYGKHTFADGTFEILEGPAVTNMIKHYWAVYTGSGTKEITYAFSE